MKQIRARILTSGPITVADYMKEVLTNPLAGYYMNRDVFGKSGDFTTSPEISQIFGELLGVWLVNEWAKAGQPEPLQLVELGPGRGTLASDVLRVFRRFGLIGPDFSVELVEVSPVMRRLQEAALADSGCRRIRWRDRLDDVAAERFSLYVAHEFFDALPVHKLVRRDGSWREVLVDLDVAGGGLRYVLSRARTPACTFVREDETRDHVEISPQSLVLVQKMASRIHRYGGIGLIVDYGHNGDGTDTFRAFREHRGHDPLVDPGTADLTADVDFAALRWAAEHPSGATVDDNNIDDDDEWKANLVYGPVEQGDFLRRMGIDVRLQRLLAATSASTDEVASRQMTSACRMLTDADAMGAKFKVMALFPAVLGRVLEHYPPHGFQ